MSGIGNGRVSSFRKLSGNCWKRTVFTVEKGVAGMPTAFVATYGKGNPVIGFNAGV